MSRIANYILAAILVFMLILIRAFESELFYDPLIDYFKNDYLYKKMPSIHRWKLVMDMLFRFLANSVLSIAIIAVLFQQKSYVKFAVYFLSIIFLLLMPIFIFLLKNNFENGYLLPFYIRRFIIHPLFLLVLLPAYYYQKLIEK